MSDDRRVSMGRGAAVLTAIALLLAGAGVTVVLVRPGLRPGQDGRDMAIMTSTPSPVAATRRDAVPVPPGIGARPLLPDIEISLAEDAVTRAGIETASAGTSTAADVLRIPGTIEADAYRRVAVTPVVPGRITQVTAELGQQVKRGDTLALIYSPGFAEAQTRYLSARAELEAAAQELKRTERLVEIGAASRQELERTGALHTTRATAVQGARAQLVLLGMPPASIGRLTSADGISANTSVPAPIDGVITERQANAGLNVEPSTPLFTVVDLSHVWVLGDLYEKDFPRVRIGSPATITTTAYPGLALGGRVSYIDPQLDEQTRTARVRVEVPNPRRELRLGMYAEMQISGQGSRPAVTVPREAVQTIGDRQFVYLVRPGARGRYIEREVRPGRVSDDAVEIASGVSPDDTVVGTGSFFVRAERERLGLRPSAAGTPPTAAPGLPGRATGPNQSKPGVAAAHDRVVKINVGDAGFEPSRVEVQQGATATLEFTRTSEKSCATEVLVPSQQIRLALPLNTPVNVDVRATEAGEIAFSCGMDMLKGTIVVR
jgi:RND family efflux transporter MFP subunit